MRRFILQNGANPIAFATDLGPAKRTIVLAETLGVAAHPYATWAAEEASPGEYVCFWGHYHDSLAEAQQDFIDRFQGAR